MCPAILCPAIASCPFGFEKDPQTGCQISCRCALIPNPCDVSSNFIMFMNFDGTPYVLAITLIFFVIYMYRESYVQLTNSALFWRKTVLGWSVLTHLIPEPNVSVRHRYFGSAFIIFLISFFTNIKTCFRKVFWRSGVRGVCWQRELRSRLWSTSALCPPGTVSQL